MYKFGNKSLECLNTCHDDLKIIMTLAIRITDIDFGISEGHRSIKKQYVYFRSGASKLDGYNRKSKHNYEPSMACDIYAYINGKASYDKESLSYIAGLIQGIANILHSDGKITHKIRWGGNWDMDGEILIDQSFDDRPHFELIKA